MRYKDQNPMIQPTFNISLLVYPFGINFNILLSIGLLPEQKGVCYCIRPFVVSDE